MALRKTIALLAVLFFIDQIPALSQCTTLGQNPSTAFPVCGTTTFRQTTVPICSSNSLFVPGCSGTGNALYQNKNPFWYKFTCYQSGTLGFVITPTNLNDDYDWQLYDITGHNPDDIFTDNSLPISGNWSGNTSLESSRGFTGKTGTNSTGTDNFVCATNPPELGGGPPYSDASTFNKMPNLIAGHQYLLLVSHYTDSQSGYDLSFGGGTAVITDPNMPHMSNAKTDCSGTKITLKLNKKIRCNSLTASGSEFSIFPAVSTVISATTTACSSGFDFDEVTITLASALSGGNYQLSINNGSDGNTLLDYCDNNIPAGEQVAFQYAIPQPIFADSIGRIGCAPNELKIYFPKRIACSSIAPDGSDFSITGPTPVTVSSASGNCINGLTEFISVKLSSPIYTKGTYQLTLKTGNDGTVVIDECGQETLVQTLSFNTADTVSAIFNYSNTMGCRLDTLHFSHNGAHDVNSWNWTFNNTVKASTQNYTIVWPASSTNTAKLVVSNGVCTDSVTNTIVLDNEVKASFDMPAVICPEDPLEINNTSTGLIDTWQWNFNAGGLSSLKDPAPVFFPNNNIESYYPIKLTATNNLLGCSDSITKVLRVFNNCFIAVPTGFTPNGDGLNDYLYPNNALKAKDLEFSVYNRWGQLVFTSKDWQKKWDGKLNGLPQPSGVYVWYLRYTHIVTGEKIFQKGTTTLIR